jgi:hypothetical protein
LLRQGPDHGGAWAARALREYPGALLCATVKAEGVVVTLRDERTIAAITPPDAPLPFDASLLASAVYACEISGHFAADLPDQLTVSAGGHTARLRLDGQRIYR